MKPTVRPWARHYMDAYGARAGDARLPYWLRVACLAYSSHEDNGHARFKRGEIALVLATVDKATGEIRPYANVARAIADAVAYGWLEEGSYWRCLIAPAHNIRKGDIYAPTKPCPIHVKRRESTKRSLSEPFDCSKPTPDEPFATRSAHSVSGSEREPLFSDLSNPNTVNAAGNTNTTTEGLQ